MISHRMAVAAALLSLLPASVARAQGDTLPVLEARVNAVRALGFPLWYSRFWRWVERVTVIDMMPNNGSNETSQDAEPNLAVDLADPTHIVGSAFTPALSGSTTLAPVYVSTNGGTTWALREIVPSRNGQTGDISEDFARRGHTLYTGILLGGAGLRQMILRTNDPFAGGTMTTLTDDSTVAKDQPYVSATTAGSPDSDRVYVGFNFYQRRLALGGTGRTASAQYSRNAATAAPPAGFTVATVEARATAQQDMPAVRFAVHTGGVIYGVFYRWASGALPRASCDVIVVRDDNYAAGASPFTALTDPSDGVAGRIVVAGGVVPAFPASLGQNRLVASNLSIAVNPNNAGHVWIAWADSDATSRYTLHVRQSTDSGRTWSADLLTVGTATNPALAINSSGMVGFLYQQLTGTPARWGTHLRRTTTGTSWSDLVLADVPNSAGTQFMGDYLDLVAVGRSFYGVFPALNTPTLANFPQGVTFQRNVDFATNQVRNLANTANVTASIDPFFFKVESTRVIDICMLLPLVCAPIVIEPGLIIIPVDTIFPVRGFDPISKNCLVKWTCPGCEQGLCPGYYHIFIDDIDPAVWKVQVLDKTGAVVRQKLQRVGNGIVLTFRPSRGNFREKDIGDYYLTFESLTRLPPGRYRFGTRLETSVYPQAQHLRQRGQRVPR